MAAAENHGAGVMRMVFYSEAGPGVIVGCPGGRGGRGGESGQRNSGFSTITPFENVTVYCYLRRF